MHTPVGPRATATCCGLDKMVAYLNPLARAPVAGPPLLPGGRGHEFDSSLRLAPFDTRFENPACGGVVTAVLMFHPFWCRESAAVTSQEGCSHRLNWGRREGALELTAGPVRVRR